MNQQTILKDFIYPAIDEVAATLANSEALKREPNALLFGPGAPLDSLGLVQFLVLVEERVAENTNLSLTIVSDKAMSRSQSPFRTLGSLADYLGELIRESK